MDIKQKIFDIFNYKKSTYSKNTPVDNINDQIKQDILINTTDSKANTATLESVLDLGNWDSGPVRPILKVRLYIYYLKSQKYGIP